jgi:hypothetical protein
MRSSLSTNPEGVRFSFTSAWAIGGGFVIPPEANKVVLFDDGQMYAYLSVGVKEDLEEVISKKALCHAEQHMRIFGSNLDLHEVHESTISELREWMEERTSCGPILCYKKTGLFSGDVDFSRCFGDEILLCDKAFQDMDLREETKNDIHAIQLALSLKSRNKVDFVHLIDFYEYRDTLGRLLYPIQVGFGPLRLYSASPIGEAFQAEVSELISQCRQASRKIPLTVRLFSKIVQREVDPLLAYIAGWAALDSLAEAVYRHVNYNEWRSSSREMMRALIQELDMNIEPGKLGAFRKHFIVATQLLFRSDSASSKRRRIEECFMHYDKRNSIIHDGDDLERIPSSAYLSHTLENYLGAYLRFIEAR